MVGIPKFCSSLGRNIIQGQGQVDVAASSMSGSNYAKACQSAGHRYCTRPVVIAVLIR
jgi:hypothetical protein